MRKLIKALLILNAIVWLPLLAHAEPLRLSDANARDAVGSEIYGILVRQCEYTTDCGFDPALHAPPRKPRK